MSLNTKKSKNSSTLPDKNGSLLSWVSICILSMGAFLVISCEEPEEGCLDIEAVNFDPQADESCCCEYPQLKLTLFHRADTNSFSVDSVYENNLGWEYQISQFGFYLHGFELKTEGGTWRSISDSVQLAFTGQGTGKDTLVPDDFRWINRLAVNITLGTFVYQGTIDSVRCKVGLPLGFEHVDPEAENDGTGLEVRTDSLNYNSLDGFLDARFELFDLQKDSIRQITWNGGYEPVLIELQGFLTVDFGDEIEIRLEIDYQNWMEDISGTETRQELVDKLRSNTSQALSLAD